MKRKIAGLLVAATVILTLAAGCSETPFSPTAGKKPSINNAPTSFGLVEVTISGVGTDKMTAYAHPAGPNVAFDLTAPSNNAALSLDGSGDYVTAHEVSDDLAGATAFTIEAWVYPGAASGGQQALFGFHTASGANRNILFYTPDTDQFFYYDSANSNVFASDTYSPGQWHHVAITITSSNNGTLYINGQSKATFTTTDRPVAGGLFSIGQEYDNGSSASNFFSGQIDELRIWNTALSQSEIQNNMNQQISPTTTGLISYYRFNEGSGTTTEDLAGDNDGVFQGEATWGAGPELAGIPPADGTIQLKPLSNGSFTVGTRGVDGMRYIYATFKVRNAQIDGTPYPSARQNLTFLAADTDETFGFTAISELRLFDGTELAGTTAKDIAEKMIPTGQAAQTKTSEIIATGADVLQIFTEAEISSIATLPNVTLFPFGFVTGSPNVTPGSRRLPANPAGGRYDGFVTFAFKLPLQAQTNQDPFEITAMFLPVDDSQTHITQSLEEQKATGKAGFLARINDMNPDYITILPGSAYNGGAHIQCDPVRVAGTPANIVTTLFPVPPSFNSITPDPYAADGSASHIDSLSNFTAAFSEPVSGANDRNFVVRGRQSGMQFIGEAYSGKGTVTITSPQGNFFAGEIVEVSLTAALGICPPQVARYRVEVAAGGGSFSPAANSPYGAVTTPVSVTMGDINSDNYLDLVVIDQSSNNISLLINDGTGDFTTDEISGVGDSPSLVALEDLNNDSYLDMAVSLAFPSYNILVFTGDGTGGFTEAAGSPYNPYNQDQLARVALGDINGDGVLDMITTGSNVSVWLGSGQGSFNLNGTYFEEDISFAADLGDLNGDGTLDIAVSQFRDKIKILLGNGTGGFTSTAGSFTVGDFPRSLELGHFNNDGYLDIVTGNWGPANAANPDKVSILLGDGSGGFGATTPFGTINRPTSLALGDLNGDRNLDIAVSSYYTNDVKLLLGDGTGNFNPATPVAVGAVPFAIALGDLNGDGALDMAVANASSGDLSVLLNQ